MRNYRLYWSGSVVSNVGTWMQQVSLPWLILALGGTPLQLGLVAVLQFGPSMVLAVFSGVYADRSNKRYVLIVTALAGFGQALVLLVLTSTGLIEIWMVMVMALWIGLVSAIELPVRQSFPADLVPRNVLANAIALESVAFNSARVVGPALAGAVIATANATVGSGATGVAVSFTVNALSYLALFIVLLRMNASEIRTFKPSRPHSPVLASLREGVHYSLSAPLVLWSLVLLAGVAAFGLSFQILLPVFATDDLSLDAVGYGAVFAAFGLGSLSGSVTLAFMRQRRVIPTMLVAGFVFSVLLAAIAVSRTHWFVLLALAGAGFAAIMLVNTVNATIQANVPDKLRGRVMALYVTVFAGSAPIGGLFAGITADAVGAPGSFLLGAACAAATIGVVSLGLSRARSRGSLGVTVIDS